MAQRETRYSPPVGGHSQTLQVYALIFTLLTFLFLLRVLAQALVAIFDIPTLPSFEEWVTPSASPFSTSGLIPYPILFPLQIAILLFQIKVCIDFSEGHGFFVTPKMKLGQFFRWFSYLYCSSMALRYVITMALYPERRWFGNTIPILLHFVLAGFLFTLSWFHTGGERSAKIVGRAR